MNNLKKIANISSIATTLFLIIGLGFVIVKNLTLTDLIAQVAFCYVAIAAFNKIMFGTPTLWNKF
jgi:hypothetical protein